MDTIKYEDLSIDARKITLYLRLEMGYGRASHVAEIMVYHATKLELAISCILNNHEMIAFPGETAEQVLERLQEHQDIIREGQS